RTLLSQDVVRHTCEKLAEDLDDFLRRMSLRVPGEIPNIEEHHRQVPDLATELQPGRIVHELLDHIRDDELWERGLRPETLAFLRQDSVDRDAHEGQGHREARVNQGKPESLEERQVHPPVVGHPENHDDAKARHGTKPWQHPGEYQGPEENAGRLE